MQNIKFPLQFTFKISTFSNDFTATDATPKVVAYVKQKLFKLKESVKVFSDETRTEVLYEINADRWLDFSAAYKFTDAKTGKVIGKVARKGWRSLWKAEYDVVDQHDQLQYKIKEDNAMTKVFDSLLGEIPILGFFTGYFFNPSYSVLDVKNNQPVAKLTKEPSFWGRRFEVDKVGPMDSDDDDRILLSLMMMILLERRRG